MLPIDATYMGVSKESVFCGKMEKRGAYYDIDAKGFICAQAETSNLSSHTTVPC
jgi:hypothetical protein